MERVFGPVRELPFPLCLPLCTSACLRIRPSAKMLTMYSAIWSDVLASALLLCSNAASILMPRF